MVGKSLHILLYSGKGENFCEFHGFVAICESFLRKFWGRGVLWHGTGEQSARFLRENHFSPSCESLLP